MRIENLLADFRSGLEGVTPGPWYTTGYPWFQSGDGVLAGSPDGNIAYIIADCDNFTCPRDEYEGPFKLGDPERDAAHIARCHPGNIREILDHIEAISSENERLKAALEPSAATKAAYIGEFFEQIEVRNPNFEDDEDDEPETINQYVPVSWTTVKAIMAAIRARAALKGEQ